MSISNVHIASSSSEPKLSGPDGPYARFEQNRFELLYVNKSGNLIRESRSPELNSIICRVDNESEDSFEVSLHAPAHIEHPQSEYPAPGSIVVISDIEGNFNALYSLLVSNKVMNPGFMWTFNDSDVVMIGHVHDED